MHRLTSGCLLAALLLSACAGPPPTPRNRVAPSTGGSALGPSYILLPLPGEDESLLGRILHASPAPGATLEEISRPNPCADHLSPPKTTPLASRFENAQEISMGGQSKAFLGSFGFNVSAEESSFFVYKLQTDKRVGRLDSVEYTECCKRNECGYGYVSALVHGKGEYAVGSETSGSGDVGVAMVASAGGHVSLKFSNSRDVQGWLAAVVTVTDPSKRDELGNMKLAENAGIQEDSLPEQMQEIYNNNKITIKGKGKSYVFRLGSGDVLTENEFVRRYRDLTGSDELDDIERRRNTNSLTIFGGLTALGLGVLYYGLANTERNCEPDDATFEDACQANAGEPGARRVPDAIFEEYYNPNAKITNEFGYVFAILGGGMATAFGIVTLAKLKGGDGGPKDHYLTDADARLYSSRYNRAFLRKTAREVRRTSWAPSVEAAPVVVGRGAPGFGLSGRF